MIGVMASAKGKKSSSIRMNVEVPIGLYENLKKKAESEGLNVSEIVRYLIVKYNLGKISLFSSEANSLDPITEEAIASLPTVEPDTRFEAYQEFYRYWGERFEDMLEEMKIMRKAVEKTKQFRHPDADEDGFITLPNADKKKRK
jgi:hypothetical protein